MSVGRTSEATILLVASGTPPPSPAVIAAIELGVAALGLIAAALFVRYRRRQEPRPAPRRAIRAALAAAAFTLIYLAADAAVPNMIGPWWPAPFIDLMMAPLIIWLGIALLIAFADAVLARLDARRNRGWLIGAPLLFAVLVQIPFHFAQPRDDIWLATIIAIALNGAAAGLVWWALLPTAPEELARRFE